MLRLIAILLILLCSIYLSVLFTQQANTVLLVYQQWIVKMPLWLFLIGLLVVFILTHVLLRGLGFFRNLIQSFHHWLERYRQNRAIDKTQRGFLALIEEQWSNAEHLLLTGIDQAKHPVVNYLYAAEAACAQKSFNRCDLYLQKAYAAVPQEIAIGLMQAKIMLAQGLHEQALSIVLRLRQTAPLHPVVLRFLEKIYLQTRAWQSLLALLPDLRKARVINAEQALILEKNTYQSLLKEASEQKNTQAVTSLWQSMPSHLQVDPAILATYANLFKDNQQLATEVEPFIRKSLHKTWQPELVKVYGLLLTAHPGQLLSHAERWLKQYGRQPLLLLTLGRLSLRARLWGQAKAYLEECFQQLPSGEVQFALATLFEQLGDSQLALQYYKNSLTVLSAKFN